MGYIAWDIMLFLSGQCSKQCPIRLLKVIMISCQEIAQVIDMAHNDYKMNVSIVLCPKRICKK